MSRRKLIGLVIGLGATLLAYGVAQEVAKPTPERAMKLLTDKNWKEAFKAFEALTLDPDADPMKVSDYLNKGVQCQQNLGDQADMDGFREAAVKVHAKNWRLLQTAANSYANSDHQGYIVAGKFNRGYPRGGRAKYVNTYERDRVRSLQLMQQAIDATDGEKDKNAVGQFYFDLANMLMGNRGYYEAWRLQYLTDLTVLPDYEEGYHYGSYAVRGAPVDADGKPVFHQLPKGWKEAKSDGERWRFALAQAMEYSPRRVGEIKCVFASFLHNQFGVQTMADYGWFFGRAAEANDDTRKDESGTWAVHTLKDDETIAKLANGIKRFKLPDEFNFIRILKEVADEKSYDHQPRELLAQTYEDRRQYPTAAEQWRQAIKDYGEGHEAYRQKRLAQIVGNWGLFESVMTQPTGGKGATVDFRFRNATKLSLTAQAIDIAKLLADVKDYLKSSPKQLDWNDMDIRNVGYRLVEKNQTKYLVGDVEKWDLDLKPRANHVDSRITIQTPLKKAGAYFVVGKLDNGNTSRIVLWVADTAIVKKNLDKGALYYVADAVDGSPIAKANLEFFGYRNEWTGGNSGRYVTTTKQFAEFSDADGMFVAKNLDANYQWVVIATTVGGDAKEGGRLAYLGFEGIWGNYYDQEYNACKVFLITDRPVYRPGGAVKFKMWVNTAKYDLEGKSEFAGQTFVVQVNDPKNEKVMEKKYTADEFGGFDGEIGADLLGKEATLGQYQIFLPGDKNPRNVSGGGHFRLEEYKKPEFEVKVDAPEEPVMLGEKVTAKVTAKYYFGAPVTSGKAKYKVLRQSHSANWYPWGYWDWFYGRGYWWFACDYTWYPGWAEWGCKRPTPIWWWNWHPREQPELVAEAEATLNKDGTFTIEIDTALAKAVHASQDHKYDITVEVTDESRRTIVGTGSVLVARKPFKVYAWVDSGHYRAGDVVKAHFNAQTLAGKPVKGDGELTLVKISYDKAKGNAPKETVVEEWKLPTNEEGCSNQQIKAAKPGQYRLVYKVTDSKKKGSHTIEGGYVFVVTGEGYDGKDYRFNDIELTSDKKEYKPGEKVDLLINTNQADSTVLLFLRPTNGTYLPPKLLRLKGKSVTESVEVV
ncbi:MAG: MG2 domain-containing protein, partial [Phycisphaerae bacterium]|nr:MG2 domain-containing protein [Phycisphaerae bacterium]